MNIEDMYLKKYQTVIVKIDECRSCSLSIPVYNNENLSNEFIQQNGVLKDLEIINLLRELEKKDKIINNSINEIEKIRQYFSEDLQVEFVRILEILKDKKVIDW